MSAPDWAACRVVRQEDAGLFFRTEDALVNAGGPTWRAQNGEAWTTRDLCELLPLVPVLDADGVPAVTTVGDLTARHIGRLVRVDYGGGEAEVIIVERVKHYGYGTNLGDGCGYLDLDTTCELLP